MTCSLGSFGIIRIIGVLFCSLFFDLCKDIKCGLIGDRSEDFSRAFFDACLCAVAFERQTFVCIDMDEIVDNRDGTGGTCAHAGFASDASNFADVLNFLAKSL